MSISHLLSDYSTTSIIEMTLQEKYKQYLAKPTEAALSTDASIHYIPTLSTFTKPQGILKHLDVQGQQLKVKANFLNVIEGDNALCVETESTIQFLLGGSAYLPGLDDNFLADRTVTLPIVSRSRIISKYSRH